MKRIAIIIACLGLSTAAVAGVNDFVNHDWYTHDTISGLYWLDITETQNMSVNEVVAELQPGGRFAGWRYATGAEFATMIANIGWGNRAVPNHIFSGDDYRVLTRKTLDLFGNTWDPYAAQSYTWFTTDPGGVRAMYGMVEDDDAYTADPDPFRASGYLHEYGPSRRLFLSGPRDTVDEHHYLYGSWLVRATVPTALPPLPDTTPAGAIDFDNVLPADQGLAFVCDGAGGGSGLKDYCSGHMMIPYASTGPNPNAVAAMWLMLPDSFDRQSVPYMRLKSFDFREFDIYDNHEVCDPGGPFTNSALYIEDAQGRHYVNTSNAVPAPQGGDWCRVTLATEFQFLPLLPPDSDIPGVTPVLKIGGEAYAANYIKGIAFDNLVVEKLAQNILIDFDPWSALNEIRPKDDYYFGLMIKTTSVAMGDPYDFDASTVDVESLRLGPGAALNIAQTILTADYDQDGDADYIFAFQVEDSGLTCVDHTVMLSGKDLSGNPIAGIDIIVPIQCDEPATIDVDPWNTANIVRPNDSYTVPVAIMSTQVANGDAGDVDATEVDPLSLRFGPNQVPHTGAIIVSDLDGDSDTDVVFGFNAYDSGIACDDTELTVEGNLYDSLPIVGTDNIYTTDCETSCHP